jgi:phage-related protein
MPSIGPRCHELRVRGETKNWQIVYRRDADAIVIGEVFSKTTRKTPKRVIETCKARLAAYDKAKRSKTGKGE